MDGEPSDLSISVEIAIMLRVINASAIISRPIIERFLGHALFENPVLFNQSRHSMVAIKGDQEITGCPRSS